MISYSYCRILQKIQQKFSEDVNRFQYLEDMLFIERDRGALVAIDALQWLRRGLHFIVCFFTAILDDNGQSDNLAPLLKSAYSESLERYHGWMGSQLFKVALRHISVFINLNLNLDFSKICPQPS